MVGRGGGVDLQWFTMMVVCDVHQSGGLALIFNGQQYGTRKGNGGGSVHISS